MSKVNRRPPLVYDTASTKPGKAVIRPRKALLTREPITANRLAAFDELHRELAIATEIFLHKGDGGRLGVYKVTCALMDYLTRRGIPYAALEPLIAVQTAIVDADRGKASPIFTPDRNTKGGRPPVSDMQRAFEGKMAAIMECCVLHCKANGERPYIEPASRLAAKLINQSSWPEKVTAKQMVELRERIQQASKDSIDRFIVKEVFKSGLAEKFPLQVANYILNDENINPPPKLSE